MTKKQEQSTMQDLKGQLQSKELTIKELLVLRGGGRRRGRPGRWS